MKRAKWTMKDGTEQEPAASFRMKDEHFLFRAEAETAMSVRSRPFPSVSVRCPFMLIELLVAITILTFGLVGVLSAYGRTADTLQKTQNQIEAMSLVQREMGRLELQALVNKGLPLGVSEGDFGDEAPYFKWRREVEEGEDGLLKLSCEVIHKRSLRSVTLVTCVAIRE